MIYTIFSKFYELKSKRRKGQTLQTRPSFLHQPPSSGKVKFPLLVFKLLVVKFPLLALRWTSNELGFAGMRVIGIDGIGWDWSYMANEDENHALVADDVVRTEFALMAMSSSSSSSDNEELKKEKESIDHKLAGFGNASKDLNDLLGTQRSVKDKSGLGLNEYTAIPPPPD
ncbi:hypothetical protein Tco_1128491 [Tanacetum coccineum]